MNHMVNISLSDEEKQTLVRLSQTAPELIIHRARLILAYADGKPTMQASTEAGISRGRARFWKREYLSRGMGIFQLDAAEPESIEEPSPSIDLHTPELLAETTFTNARESVANSLTVIPYPEVQQLIGITPDDTLAEAGKKVWLYYFAVMLSHEAGTVQGENIEELHDMLLATRRMRAAFDIFGPAFDSKTIKHHLKGLRTIGRVLGKVRDMDVILENAIAYQRKLKESAGPGLEPLLNEWKEVINRQHSKMIKHLQSEAYGNFKQNFNSFLQAPEYDKIQIFQDEGSSARVRDTVPVLVYSRYAAARAYESILLTASVTQLHALRIEFKRFRYTLEYFTEILGEGANKAINELKEVQDH